MTNWKYEPTKKFKRIPDGDYRLRIAAIEEGKKNYKFLKFIYDVSGENAQACSYLTLNTDDPGMVNWLINLMADTFGIDLNAYDTIDFTKWIGCFGAGTIQKDGKFKENRVVNFIMQKDQHRLPEWEEYEPESDEDNTIEWDEELENW